MKAALAVCLFGLVGFTIAQECADQVVDYVNCLKGQGEAKRAEFEAKRKEFEAKEPEFKACLTAGGCTPPQEGQPGETGETGKGKGKGGKSGKGKGGKSGKGKGGFPGLGNVNETVKACLKTQFETKVTAKLTQCLGHAPPTWLNQVVEKLKANHQANGNPHKGRWGKHGGHHGGANGCSKDVVKGCFKTVFNIDKDSTDHAAPTPDQRKAQKEAHCAAAATCEASITGQCKTDFDEIKTKTCSCTPDHAAVAADFAQVFTTCGAPLPFGGQHGGPRVQGVVTGAVAKTGKGKHGKRSFKPPFCKCQPGQDNDDDEDEDDDE